MEVRLEVGAKEKDLRRDCRAQRTETGPGRMCACVRLEKWLEMESPDEL